MTHCKKTQMVRNGPGSAATTVVMKAGWVVVFSMLASVAAACGSDGSTSLEGGGDPVDAAPIARVAYAAEIAEVTCEALEDCGCDAQRVSGGQPTYPNGEACRYEEELAFEAFVAEALEAGLQYDETCGGEQQQRIQERGCDWAGGLVDACNPCPVIHGDKPLGVRCERYGPNEAYSDCARGLLCPHPKPGTQDGGGGVCVEACAAPIAEGESCDDEASGSSRTLPCVEGTYCLGEVCTPGGEVGEPCRAELECVTGAYCDGIATNTSTLGVCTARAERGEACSTDRGCTDSSCLRVPRDDGASVLRCAVAGDRCESFTGPQGGFSCVDGGWVEIGAVCSGDLTRQLYSRFPY